MWLYSNSHIVEIIVFCQDKKGYKISERLDVWGQYTTILRTVNVFSHTLLCIKAFILKPRFFLLLPAREIIMWWFWSRICNPKFEPVWGLIHAKDQSWYFSNEQLAYGWLADIVPLKGLKYRYELPDPRLHLNDWWSESVSLIEQQNFIDPQFKFADDFHSTEPLTTLNWRALSRTHPPQFSYTGEGVPVRPEETKCQK